MIIWEDRVYNSIEKLNLQVGIIDLNIKGGGGYFTHLAISPPKYREKHPTKR